MQKHARTDFLTQLLNRFGLRESFELLKCQNNNSVAVFCFDLDGFKGVNDRLGHRAGDEILTEIGKRLRTLLTDQEIGARTGGDEFVVVSFYSKDTRSAIQRAETIVSTLCLPYEIAGVLIPIGVSLGAYSCQGKTADLEHMMVRADAASYVAKRRGGGIEFAGV